MRKKLLIISNNHGLPGVKKDVLRIKQYFKSVTGGLWNDNEIEEAPDESRYNLTNRLLRIRDENHDYLIIYFSGHGDWKRQTNLYLNSAEESIPENYLNGLAARQLSIFDCCRGVEDSSYSLSDLALFSEKRLSLKEFNYYREQYDYRILRSRVGTHIKLYSCTIGQLSQENIYGGVYTTELIRSAINSKPGEIDPIVLQNAVSIKVHFDYPNQLPDYDTPRIPEDERVVFGIKYQINS